MSVDDEPLDEGELTSLIGAMARNNAAMERDLRSMWVCLADPRTSLAAGLAPKGTSKLIQQCDRMLRLDRKPTKWVHLTDARRDIALAVLSAARVADAERDRMVHRTWFATVDGGWIRDGVTNGGTARDSITMAEVRSFVSQAKDASIRVMFLSGAIFQLSFEAPWQGEPNPDLSPEMYFAAANGDYQTINGFLAFGKAPPADG